MATLFFTSLSAASPPLRQVSRAVVIFALAGLAAAALGVAWFRPYAPGSDTGYALGLGGGLMMLALLAYPLRKHFPALAGLGPMKPWFQAHMALGILGPVLVVFHTGFTVASANAAVAFACMVVVALSGFIGRYAYRRIHHGLYGRRATLRDMEQQMEDSGRGLASFVRASPAAQAALERYREEAFDRSGGPVARARRFFALAPRARRLADELDHEILAVVRKHGPHMGWNGLEQTRRARRGFALVREYLGAVRSGAQFAAYERIFSLWHVLHIPLVYLLVASAAYHVLAVHMY